MDYIVPRSVSKLEAEIEELERSHQTMDEEPQKEEKIIEDSKPLDKEEETFKKRYSDLRRHQQEQKLALEARIKELEEKASQSGSRLELPSAEEAEEWAKANPKAAAMIRALAGDVAPKTTELNEVKKEVDRIKQEAKIRKAHPDFDDIVSDPEFHDWANDKPASFQNMVYGKDADDIIWALKQFKREKDVTEDPNKLAAKSVTKGRKADVDKDAGRSRFSESIVNQMSLAEYEKNEEAIQEAMRSGKFVYDLTGGAR